MTTANTERLYTKTGFIGIYAKMSLQASVFSLLLVFVMSAQSQPATAANGPIEPVPRNKILYYYINSDGDTVLYWYLPEVVITAPRYFKSGEDYRRYLQYRLYAASVQPYARKAVQTWRQIAAQTNDAKRRDRRRTINDLQDELQKEFKEPLKKLSRTQGHILIKMIERELHMPFYDILKELKGGLNAQYWHQFSKIYGFDLNDGYIRGRDPVLDAVLDDFTLNDGY